MDGSLFILDTPGFMDDIAPTKNKGLDTRKEIIGKSAVIELIGRLHLDISTQSKLLLNGVDLKIVLSLEKPDFFIMEDAKGKSVLSILDATLYMNHVTVNPGVLLAHEAVLSKRNAYYPYRRIEVKAHTIAAGNQTLSIQNAVIGELPNFLLFAMVDNDAYTGSRTTNPFNFQHYSMTNFYLIVNGAQLPLDPLTFDYTSKPCVSTRAYNNIFKSSGIKYSDKGNLVR